MLLSWSCSKCSVRRSTARTVVRWKPWLAISCASTRLTIAVAEIVHGRAAGVASDGRAWQLGLRGARRRLLQQPIEDRAGGRAGGPHRGTRRCQRAGREGDGGGDSEPGRNEYRDRHHRASRDLAEARPEKPVGTVSVAVIGDDESRVRTFQFIGGRDMVKFQAAQAALNMTRLAVMKIQGPREWAERR